MCSDSGNCRQHLVFDTRRGKYELGRWDTNRNLFYYEFRTERSDSVSLRILYISSKPIPIVCSRAMFARNFPPGGSPSTLPRTTGVVGDTSSTDLSRCDCGHTVIVNGCHLRSESTSCACWYRDSRYTANLRHGDNHSQAFGGSTRQQTRTEAVVCVTKTEQQQNLVRFS